MLTQNRQYICGIYCVDSIEKNTDIYTERNACSTLEFFKTTLLLLKMGLFHIFIVCLSMNMSCMVSGATISQSEIDAAQVVIISYFVMLIH
jgi:hypothetical protein